MEPRARTKLVAVALVVVFCFAFLADQVAFVEAATVTIGGTSVATDFANMVAASPITFPASGEVQTIGINWESTRSGNVRVALYSDGGTKPGSLLTESTGTVMSGSAGWQDIAVAQYTVSAGRYWVAFLVDSTRDIYFDSGTRSYYRKSFGPMDATWSASSTQDSYYTANMRVTYSTGPTFSISASPASQSVSAGSTASYTLSLTADTGYGGTVTLVLSPSTPCPTGATCAFDGSPSTSVSSFPASVTFSIATSTSGFTGTSTLTVSASDGTNTRTADVSLTVTPYVGPDFSISASPTSQSAGAGGTATYTLSLAASGGYSGTVALAVASGCPSGITCSITPSSVNSFPATATLSVPTLITTPSGTRSVVVTATDGTITRMATVSLTLAGAASYNFNVKAGATQIVVTLTYSWTGSGAPPSGAITIAGPGDNPVMQDSGAVVYDRTSIVVSGGTNTYSLIHRVTFTIAPPASAEVWTALVSLSGVSSYNLTIEVS